MESVPMTTEARLDAIVQLKDLIGDSAESISRLRHMLSQTERMHQSFKEMLNALVVEDLRSESAPRPEGGPHP